ncbi:hypothetical protein Tsubulata_034629, partial [Turnera subulata]
MEDGSAEAGAVIRGQIGEFMAAMVKRFDGIAAPLLAEMMAMRVQEIVSLNHLTNTFGLTPESALAASNYARFNSREKPESVIKLFKTYGFSQCISTSSIENPFAASYLTNRFGFNPESALRASKYLRFKSHEKPEILKRSLENYVIPVFNCVKDVGTANPIGARRLMCIIAGVELRKRSLRCLRNVLCSWASLRKKNSAVMDFVVDKLGWGLSVFAQYPVLFGLSLEKRIIPRDSVIKFLLSRDLIEKNSYILGNYGWLKQTVEELKEMGFNASKRNFVTAMVVEAGHSQSNWSKKIDMFKKCPLFMGHSEEKNSAVMDFVVNKLGWGLSVFAQYPVLFGLSLEKRFIPRDSVIQFLLSRDLIEKKCYTPRVFKLTDAVFLDKY